MNMKLLVKLALWVFCAGLLTMGMGSAEARADLVFTFVDGDGAPQSGDHNCSFVDMDNDGIDELYTNYWPKKCYRFKDGIWQDISSTTGGLCSETRTADHGLVFFDADNDGDFDFMDDDNYLYANDGRGFFSDLSASVGLEGYLLKGEIEAGVYPEGAIFRTRGVSAGDIDGDGDNDVWVTGDGYHLGSYTPPRNYLFINQLKETGILSFIEDAASRGRDSYGDMSDNRYRPQYVRQGSMFFDYDDDGDLDLYITVNGSEGWYKGPYCCEAKNELWENDGTGHFTEVAQLRGIEAPNSRGGTNVGDLDNDGYLDVVVDAARIYRYDPIHRVYVLEQVFDFPGFASCVGDFDHDGDLDIYPAGANVILENRIKENGWKNGFVSRPVIFGGNDSWRYLDARGCAMADFDNDGDMDIYWTHMADQPWYGKTRGFLLRNDLPPNQNWLKVKLRGPHGDAAAVGAKVRVYQGGYAGDPNYFVARRDAISVQGYMDNHSQILHFGLAAGQTYDVVVTFLTGETRTLSQVAPGQLLFIEGAQNDNQPPVISNVTSTQITLTSATINWSTDKPADSQVEYGLNTGYGQGTPVNATLTQNHSVVLSGLSPNTLYHYRVLSQDAGKNLAASGDYTFQTAVNQVPVAYNGTATTTPGAAVHGTLSGSDADGDALIYSLVTKGGLGTAQITNASTGAYTYTPDAGVTGTDEFTFKVNDGTADSNAATVTVTIKADSSSTLALLRLVKGSRTYPGEGWDNAIDGDTQGWDGTVSSNSNPPYAIFAFADNSVKTLSKVRLMSDTGVRFPNRWVAQFTVQVSTTDTRSSSFTTVLNRVSKSGGAWEEYAVNPTPAKYIKLIVNEPSSSYWKQVGEFEAYVKP
jgi:hypothetical protein